MAPQLKRLHEVTMEASAILRRQNAHKLADDLCLLAGFATGAALRPPDAVDLEVIGIQDENKRLREALEKIADPRKRDHKEPDAYTTLGCVMRIAQEAIAGPVDISTKNGSSNYLSSQGRPE